MMDADRKARLVANLSLLPRRMSAWVMSLAGTMGFVWLNLPADQRLTLLQHSPLPVWAYPIALTVVGLLSQIWPRKNQLSPDEAAVPPLSEPVGKDRSE